MKDTQGAKSTKIKALVLSIVLHHQSCLHIVFYCEIQAGILFKKEKKSQWQGMTSENGYTKYLKAGRCVILAAMLNAY